MRDNHISTILEEKPPSRLSSQELALIEAHTSACRLCSQAYETARISESLLKARAAESVEVSPFFKTRVMAAIRESRQSAEVPQLVRLWRMAGALVSTLILLVLLLVGVTALNYGPDTQPEITEISVAADSIFSPEYLVLEHDGSAEDGLAYDQVLGTVYGAEGGDGN